MLLLAVLLCSGALFAQPIPPDLKTYIEPMRKNLMENILKFWYPRGLDTTNGGYQMHFDANGTPKSGTKMIVTQARMVWFYARMARAGHGDTKQMLAAADTGFRFLRDKMWDKEHGGYLWEVDATGTKVIHSAKHLYGQAFALYGLSEFALASKRKDVMEMALRQFEVMEQRAHDNLHGGYREWFSRDWQQAPASETPYLGAGTGSLKLMNTHLHLMEAMTTFYEATKLPLARERLLELIAIESNSVVRKDLAACTDKYERDWTPRLDNNWNRVSYGHDIENVWLLDDALHVAGLAKSPYLDLFRQLFAYSRKYGYDESRGGFYDSGPFRGPASQRQKVWWVQSEALVSSLRMYTLTRDPSYLAVFRKTWDFVNQHQTDWEHGEWHATVDENLAGFGDKGQSWKSAYHNGRAMIECIRMLQSLQ